MSIACIIESEDFFANQIETSLKEIDGRLNVLRFRDLEEYYKWFSGLIKSDSRKTTTATEAPEKKSEDLKLLIGDIRFLGPRYFSLIEKVRKLMVRRGLIQAENDLAIMLTAFDSPNLNFKQIESRIITNVIFKPFDLPILKQQLQIALANQKAVTDFVVYNQKIKATAEMLKEVQLEAFNELGFTTRSNRSLEINTTSKYYSPYFIAPGQTGVLARCISCLHHPEHPEEFRAEFRYYGISNAQVKKLRQTLFAIEQKKSLKQPILKRIFAKFNKRTMNNTSSVNFIAFVKDFTDPTMELKEALEENLSNVSITFNKDIAKFTEALSKDDISVLNNKPIHGLFINLEHFSTDHGPTIWTKIQEQIEIANRPFLLAHPKPRLFLLTPNLISEENLREWSHVFADVIQLPLDRPFLNKRMMTLFPEMKPLKDSIEVLSTSTNEIIRVANPIELASISEASLTMKYYRPISFHAFRRFCLPSAHGEEVLEMLGSCYFSEKKDNLYINHFVFFGITDKYLRYVRKWILERYIASKDPAA